MSDPQSRGFSSGVQSGIALALLVYFVFPVVLIYPLVQLEKVFPPARMGVVLFAPIGILCRYIPPYAALIAFELRVVRLN